MRAENGRLDNVFKLSSTPYRHRQLISVRVPEKHLQLARHEAQAEAPSWASHHRRPAAANAFRFSGAYKCSARVRAFLGDHQLVSSGKRGIGCCIKGVRKPEI
jgi:hypothetical protein